LLSHFEDHDLLKAYNENPRMDVHEFVAQAIFDILGLHIERRAAKAVNFGMLYGMGLGALSESMDTDVQTAKRIKAAQLSALPGLRQLQDDIKEVAKSGQPIRTFGGRTYYPEEPRVINGRLVDFVYKLLNYLIQGSAADFTKEAIIRYHKMRKDSRFLVTVYDEINISAPKGSVKREMQSLREAMEGIEIDVPMLTDAKSGPNWGSITKYED
jgi:DNA polymerase-1